MRAFRNNSFLKPQIDLKEFASRFKKYEYDQDNYALYIWGYIMLMHEYYETTGQIISGHNYMTHFGEPNVFPQIKYEEHFNESLGLITTKKWWVKKEEGYRWYAIFIIENPIDKHWLEDFRC